MQLNTKRSSAVSAHNRDDQGAAQTSTKKKIQVIVIESSDEESEAESLTAAFAQLATSQKSPDRIGQSSGTKPSQQETPLRAHRNTKIHYRGATPSAPCPAPAAVSTSASVAPSAPVAVPAPAPAEAPPPYSPASSQPPLQRATGSSSVGPPLSPRPTPFKKRKFYVVSVGKCTGVFDQWSIVSRLTSGVSGAAHKSYKSYSDALEDYMYLKSIGLVRVERQPGDELVLGPIELAMQ